MPEIVRNIFENYVKDRFDLQDCIAVNSGTSALIATLWSMDLKPGDEVITTPFTFIATTNAIIWRYPVYFIIAFEHFIIYLSKIIINNDYIPKNPFPCLPLTPVLNYNHDNVI